MTVVLDSGALIASENNDRMFASFISATRSRGHSILIPATVLAETWRGASTHPRAARLLGAIDGFPVLEERAARATGSLLAARFANVLVVPCTTSFPTEFPSLCVELEPDRTNGFDCLNWALAHGVTSSSKRRIVRETTHFIASEQLAEIRSRIAEALDILD